MCTKKKKTLKRSAVEFTHSVQKWYYLEIFVCILPDAKMWIPWKVYYRLFFSTIYSNIYQLNFHIALPITVIVYDRDEKYEFSKYYLRHRIFFPFNLISEFECILCVFNANSIASPVRLFTFQGIAVSFYRSLACHFFENRHFSLDFMNGFYAHRE